MTGVVFRAARQEDVAAIVALLANDIRGKGREDASLPLDPRYFAGLDAIEASGCNELIVGTAEGRVIACAQLTFIPGLSSMGATRAMIEGVRVAEAIRGRKIGERLIGHLVAKARAANCHTVQLTTNKTRKDAHRFYARIGFVNSHEGFKLDL